jgi:hypothetical protein
MRWLRFSVTAGVLTLTILSLTASAQHGGRSGGSKAHGGGPGIKVRPGKGGTQLVNISQTGPGSKATFVKRQPGVRKPLTSKQRKAVQDFVQTSNLSTQEKSAVDKVVSGTPLSATDRSTISALLVRNPASLTAEAREALNQAVADDMEQRMAAYTRRFLRVHNDTGERLKVWVQYRTLSVKQTWEWYPAIPAQSRQALGYDVEPSAVVDLEHTQGRISASRARLWARSSTGREWGDFRDRDLWLVPETDDQGSHRYYAAEAETFTFTFER